DGLLRVVVAPRQRGTSVEPTANDPLALGLDQPEGRRGRAVERAVGPVVAGRPMTLTDIEEDDAPRVVSSVRLEVARHRVRIHQLSQQSSRRSSTCATTTSIDDVPPYSIPCPIASRT